MILVLMIMGNFTNAYAFFSDVSSGHVNYDAIKYVQDNGIVSGYQDGTFKPDKTINRAEFTKIIVAARFPTAAIDSCIADNVEATQGLLDRSAG
jgi:hypothetical protein